MPRPGPSPFEARPADPSRLASLTPQEAGLTPQGDGESESLAAVVTPGPCIISHTREGVSGNSRTGAPKRCSAFATALATTPPAPMMPHSPAPLAPSGLFGERAGQQLAVLVVDQVLKQGPAEPLHESPEHLTAQCHWIDDPPAVDDDYIIDDLHPAELRINGYVGGLRAVAVGVLVIEERA